MTPHNKEEIIKNYITAYNSFDLEGMCSQLHAEIEFIYINKGETNLTLNGIDAFKVQAEQTAAMFKARKQEIISIVYGDNHVEVDIHYTGTLAVEFPNGLKVGDDIELKGKSVFQFYDGLILKLVDMS
ncbi:nuclear transport factor 2 family protein [Pedobacter frigiditerrae]|uniref:Nuclear transport factor 2 family protein n=1 Tax=Pedobacter frigiditerrae TaxID=2530452 RepID=A0A4V2MIY6_9SPHI|nr:nuclear transport factor 2 family protein [Pedobacter frigiditerrae]TCC91896.1 nuclear transport factor 2 family protein [Pedobacter frigiditerrae]